MKRLFIFAIAGVLLCSCDMFQKKSSAKTDAGDDDEEFSTTQVSYSYSDDNGNEISISVDYPDGGSSALCNAIAEAISENLDSSYDGDLDDGQAVVDTYGDKLRDEYLSQVEEFDDDEDFSGNSKDITISVEYETDKLVTYTFTIDSYSAGAIHGYQTLFGLTFRKSDGRRFGRDMMCNLSDEEFHNIVKQGLKDYFADAMDESVVSDEDLKEYILTEDDVDHLPLPNAEPYITERGVNFVYQPYEISFYAAGHPSFVIPLRMAKHYLTSAARKMTKED